MTLALLAVAALVPAALPAGLEAHAGLGSRMTQHVFTYDLAAALDLGVRVPLRGAWAIDGGARLASSGARAEAYLRLAAAPALGRWAPLAGLELGLSSSAGFSEGELLLRETREATEQGVGHVFVAFVAEPLALRRQRWRLSILDLGVGTYLADAGRTLRVQLGFLSVGWTP